MVNEATTPTLQDILRSRQQSDFVGRMRPLADFRANWRYDITDERRKFVFSIYGQGGVGKTLLAGRFRKIAEEYNTLTAWTDDAETDVPSVMARIAAQLEEQGHLLKAFNERYKVYRQRKQELEADPGAPQGLTAFLSKAVVKAGASIARHTPAGVVLEFIDEDALANEVSEWAEFVRHKLTNKDETDLVLKPNSVLTPLWLAGLNESTQAHHLVLIFDTYERSCVYLDAWLREVLDGRYGVVPASIVWVIAGRNSLDDNNWAPYRGLTAMVPLEPFSDDEAREYLSRKGIDDPKIIEVILRLSGRLPLLMATLAKQRPSDAKHIDDPSDTAVERFLKWVSDPNQRRAALQGALPRRLNQDVLACMIDPVQIEPTFAWLQVMPFVQKRDDFWQYHEVVRSAMLRYLRSQSPKMFADLHRRLAEHYESMRDALGLEVEQGYRDDVWQETALEVLYHQLCQAPKLALPSAIAGFLTALAAQGSFAARWVTTMREAGEDSASTTVSEWAQRFLTALDASDKRRYTEAIEAIGDLPKSAQLTPRTRAIALDWRGRIYLASGQGSNAEKDLSEAVGSNPQNAGYHLDLGQAYRMLHKKQEVLNEADHALALGPDYHRAHELRGRILQEMEQYPEALTAFTEAQRTDEECHSCIGNRGTVFRSMGRYVEAIADLNKAIKIAPDCIFCITNRGETYLRMGQYHEALADFDHASALEPQYHHALELRAQVFDELNQPEEALLASRDAERTRKNCHSCLGFSGRILFGMRRYEDALADLNKALSSDPNCAGCIGTRGQCYQMMGRYEEALVDFDRAIEQDPTLIQIIIERADTLCRFARYEDALADLNRVVELDPTSASAISVRADTLRQSGRYRDALKDFERAIELGYDRRIILNGYGLTLSYIGHYAEAIDLYREGLLRIHNNYVNLYNIAVATVRWKGLEFGEGAMRQAQEALEDADNPDPGAVLYGLGGLAALIGDSVHALEYLRQAIPLEPSAREWAQHDIAWLDLRPNPTFQALVYQATRKD
jgi:tetratricopeptide (TPR) repeat protein